MNRGSLSWVSWVAAAACGAAVSGAAVAAVTDVPAPGAPAAPPAPAVAPAPAAVPAPPVPGVPAASELEAARARLNAAVQEVARLSTQMAGPAIQRFNTFGDGQARTVIGVVISNDSDGAKVLEVSPGGAAAEAGLRAGDLIVSIDGTDVKGDDSGRKAVTAIHNAAPDSKLKIRALRDGKPRDFVVAARPVTGFQAFTQALPMPSMPGDIGMGPFAYSFHPSVLGLANMELATLTPQLGRYFGTDKGVLVVRSPTDSHFKLQDGDVILTIDGREPVSGAHATRILSSYQPGEKVTLHILRERKAMDVETKLPEFTAPAIGQPRMLRPGDATS